MVTAPQAQVSECAGSRHGRGSAATDVPAEPRADTAAGTRQATQAVVRSQSEEWTSEDDELAATLGRAVTRLHRRLRQQSQGGLTPSQVSLLGSVDRLGSPTLGELAAAEQVQPPTVTRLVAAMEASDLLSRATDADDRRVSRVHLTGAGRRRLQRVRSLKTALLTRRLAELTADERRQLAGTVSLLERLGEPL